MPITSKKKYNSFQGFVKKILKQEYKDGIRSSSLPVIDAFIVNFLTRLSEVINVYLSHSSKKTVTVELIDRCLDNIFDDSTFVQSVREHALASIEKYKGSKDSSKPHSSKSSRAGLELPVSRVVDVVRSHSSISGVRIGDISSIYITSVTEFLVKSILNKTVSVTTKAHRKQLAAADVKSVIEEDEMLRKTITKNAII
jgi:histone H3/H4